MIGIYSYKDLDNYDIVRPTLSESNWYLILLGNPFYVSPAFKMFMDNYKYLNRRTKDVRYFVPGYRVNKAGMTKPSAKSFDEEGFIETIEWLEENVKEYTYSENMEMILLPYNRIEVGGCSRIQYVFENMLWYNLDHLLKNGTNIIKFINKGVEVIHKNVTPEDTRRLMGETQDIIMTRPPYKVFIAGSKALASERDGIRSELSILSNLGEGNIAFQTMTFEDFDRSFVIGGRQEVDYDTFIRRDADAVVFIIDNRVGGITRKEFNIAIDSFKEHGRPNIYAYYKTIENEVDNYELKEIIKIINDNNQYYNEYRDLKDLKDEVYKDFSKLLIKYK